MNKAYRVYNKAYRVYNEKSGEVLLTFVATSDEEAIEKAKEMYYMEEHNDKVK